MNTKLDRKSANEIEHGRFLASSNAQDIWGWESSVGKVRAQRRSKLIIRKCGLGPSKTALEAGCGTGIFTKQFAATGAELTALDISSELLNIAKQKSFHPSRVTFVEGRFEDCQLNNRFDTVIGSSVLHHLDVPLAVKQIRSLLKPGGAMCFAEPNMLNPQIALQKNIPWLKKRLGDSPDETAIMRWRLARLLKNYGFEEIQIIPFDWLHPVVPIKLIPFVSMLGRMLEKTPIIREFAGSVLIYAKSPN